MTFSYWPIDSKHYDGKPYTATGTIDLNKNAFVGVLTIGCKGRKTRLGEFIEACRFAYTIINSGEQIIIRKAI